MNSIVSKNPSSVGFGLFMNKLVSIQESKIIENIDFFSRRRSPDPLQGHPQQQQQQPNP